MFLLLCHNVSDIVYNWVYSLDDTLSQCFFPMPHSIAVSSEMMGYWERDVTITTILMDLQPGTQAFSDKRERLALGQTTWHLPLFLNLFK